jgi:cell division protein FtsI/penicillin-binding protein 2
VRVWPSALLAPIVALVAAGCAAGPSPADEAERLAADLTDGTFDSATIANQDQPDEALATILGNLADKPRAVEVGEITESETSTDLRTVDLTWTWNMGEDAEDWVVETTAQLERIDGAWVSRWSPTLVHPDAAETSSLRLTRTPASRGDILGDDGPPVVTARPVYDIGIDKANAGDAAATSAAALDLATRLGFDNPAAFADRVANAGPSAYVIAITVREDDSHDWDVPALRNLPGVLVRWREIPLAPTATFARPIIGTVGEATAEIIEASDGAIALGDQVGLSGLQKQYDEELRGTPGATVIMRTDGTDQELYAAAPVDGTDLVITLDIPLQRLAEEILAPVEPASAIVAIQPSTGRVLAAASGPGGGGLSTATLGLYPPGSTFKIATALASLRHGLTPDSPVQCPATLTVNGREFSNYPGYPASSLGTVPFREALAQSCNTAMIAQGEVVSSADLASAAESLGIGATGTLAFPYTSGSVPDDSTGTEHAANLIGQGKVLASPMAMAVAAASVASGSTVTPLLVTAHGSEADPPEVPLTAAEAADLQSLMRGVVTSGTSTFLQDVPGEPVSAKSGTAQYGTSDPPLTNAWMIAFQGDLAVAVFVELGEYGTATAGPLLEDFLRGAAG